MKELGSTAKAVNSITKAKEDKNGTSIWKLVESKICVILLSPEMLEDPGSSRQPVSEKSANLGLKSARFWASNPRNFGVPSPPTRLGCHGT